MKKYPYQELITVEVYSLYGHMMGYGTILVSVYVKYVNCELFNEHFPAEQNHVAVSNSVSQQNWKKKLKYTFDNGILCIEYKCRSGNQPIPKSQVSVEILWNCRDGV